MISHERVLVLDSKKEELRYYSEVPPLPILSEEDFG